MTAAPELPAQTIDDIGLSSHRLFRTPPLVGDGNDHARSPYRVEFDELAVGDRVFVLIGDGSDRLALIGCEFWHVVGVTDGTIRAEVRTVFGGRGTVFDQFGAMLGLPPGE